MDAVTLGEVKKAQKAIATLEGNLGALDKRVVEMVNKINTALSNMSELVLVTHSTGTLQVSETESVSIDIPNSFNKFMLKSIYVLGTSDTSIKLEIVSSTGSKPFVVYRNIVKGNELYDVADLPYIDEDDTARLHVRITNTGTQPGTFNLRVAGVTLG